MPDVFLSYAREDQSTARRFAEGLERSGFSVWWDQALHPGEAFDQVTEKALEEAKAVVVLWSKASVNSRWVRAEATQANADNRLVPVMIEACKRPIMFELTHTAELSSWKGNIEDPAWQSFVASVRRFIGNANASAGLGQRLPVPVATPVSASLPRRTGFRIAAVGLTLLLLAGGTWWVLGRPGMTGAAPPAASVDAPIRLAVLPFENLSSDPDQAYLSSGLAEDLALQLNQVQPQALRANGPEQTGRFKGGDADLRAIATELGVDHLLTGTFRKEGESWRFTAKLIDGKDGIPLWDQKYNAEGSGLFAMQDELVRDVALAVGVVLGVQDYPRRLGGTLNVEAYQLFLRSREAWRNGQPPAGQAEFLLEAVKQDPEYYRAWNTLYATLRNAMLTAPRDAIAGLREEQERAAGKLRAVAHDTALAQRHQTSRSLEQQEWAKGVAAAEAALSLARSDEFDSNFILGYALSSVGRVTDAIPFFRTAVDAEPFLGAVSINLRSTQRAVGREADAQREEQRAMAHGISVGSPPPKNLEDLRHLELGRIRPDGTLGGAFLGQRPDVLNDLASARKALWHRFEEVAGDAPGAGYAMLPAAAALGDDGLAVAIARRTLKDTPELTTNLLVRLWSLPFNYGSPEFKEFLRGIGLAAYWRDSGKWGDFCREKGADDFVCFDKPVTTR